MKNKVGVSTGVSVLTGHIAFTCHKSIWLQITDQHETCIFWLSKTNFFNRVQFILRSKLIFKGSFELLPCIYFCGNSSRNYFQNFKTKQYKLGRIIRISFIFQFYVNTKQRTTTIDYQILQHNLRYFPFCKPYIIREQCTLWRHPVYNYVLKQLKKIGSCALFSFRARYDAVSFSNCTKELSFAWLFCMAVWKLKWRQPCSITEQNMHSYVLTVYSMIQDQFKQIT